MNPLYKYDEWMIIEDQFDPDQNRASESIFSIGNGKIGQRANFEEKYSGDSLQGNYVAGIYYPDKTRVGWWKNGYPEYYAKVLNAANWIGIDIEVNGNILDLANCTVKSFRRELNMKEGLLTREFVAILPGDLEVEVSSRRFLSMVQTEIGAIKYSIKALNFSGELKVCPYLDLDIRNEDANFDEIFWNEVEREIKDGEGYITGKTKKTDFHVCTGMNFQLLKNAKPCGAEVQIINEYKWIANECKIGLEEGDEVTLIKYAANVTSLDHPLVELCTRTQESLKRAAGLGFEKLFEAHKQAWARKWEESDIVIEGDLAAQQGIRFSIFQLNQTYTGEDERLNIGPKGFTGEKYGGSTYWDTEAFALPFYLCTANPDIARNLLLYRYKHLEKAIQNAEKLGFTNGAALYPMVTMNGEECHNEWEITFEEIHRNGAIAYAIHNYIRHTGDDAYLAEYGLEVLISLSRFWRQRVNFSEEKQKYVMLGVTGPNEYENNVDNNWYTNTIAVWTLEYTLESIEKVRKDFPERFAEITKKLDFEPEEEMASWKTMVENMYFPYSEKYDVFLQQDGYLDKKAMLAGDLDPEQRPLNQHWSWDRILRSPFIKQADVLQGIYFFEERYDIDTIRRNFEFYEARTVHESSLSPCIHSILASRIGEIECAYNMYLRTSRLDLDDYNKEVAEGLHITSMGGTWLSIVEGFGGMRIRNGVLSFNPLIPEQWKSFSFHVRFRGNLINVIVHPKTVEIQNLSDKDIQMELYGSEYLLEKQKNIKVSQF